MNIRFYRIQTEHSQTRAHQGKCKHASTKTDHVMLLAFKLHESECYNIFIEHGFNSRSISIIARELCMVAETKLMKVKVFTIRASHLKKVYRLLWQPHAAAAAAAATNGLVQSSCMIGSFNFLNHAKCKTTKTNKVYRKAQRIFACTIHEWREMQIVSK